MKHVLVGFVAALSFFGCGVGVEGLDEQAALEQGSAQQQLEQMNQNSMETQGKSLAQQITGFDPRGLPQDPMPFHEGKIPRPEGTVQDKTPQKR